MYISFDCYKIWNGNNFNECMQITGGQMLVRDISSSVPIDPLVPMTCCTGLQLQLIGRGNFFSLFAIGVTNF